MEQIVADIKESICRASDQVFDDSANANIPTVSYEVRLQSGAGGKIQLKLRHLWDAPFSDLLPTSYLALRSCTFGI